jgi:hypothetical protein
MTMLKWSARTFAPATITFLVTAAAPRENRTYAVRFPVDASGAIVDVNRHS